MSFAAARTRTAIGVSVAVIALLMAKTPGQPAGRHVAVL
jgi:hypothetical protein